MNGVAILKQIQFHLTQKLNNALRQAYPDKTDLRAGGYNNHPFTAIKDHEP